MIKYPNPAIKSYVSSVFELIDDDYYILGEFSKMGETYRNRINLAHLSDRQVSRRIDTLHKNNFLRLIKSTPYRNIPGKQTRIFGLTFKGFLASLNYVNLENTYLFKSYQKILETKISNIIIPFYEKYVKYSLLYFLIINKIIGLKFDHLVNMVNWFDNVLEVNNISNYDKKFLQGLKENVEDYSEEIELNIPNKIYDQEQMENWYYLRNYWYHIIEKITQGKRGTKILSEMRKEYPSRFENEIKRHHMERLKIDMSIIKQNQLKTDKIVGHRKKSTKHTN